jgi:hypothetical protein
MVIHTPLVRFLVVVGSKVFVFRFAVDDGEEAKKELGLFVGRRCSAYERPNWRPFRPVRGPVFGTCVLVRFIIDRRHDRDYHLALEAGEAPCLSCKFDDALHCDLDSFFFLRVSKVLDRVDNLFNDGTGSCVDALLGAAAGKSCE